MLLANFSVLILIGKLNARVLDLCNPFTSRLVLREGVFSAFEKNAAWIQIPPGMYKPQKKFNTEHGRAELICTHSNMCWICVEDIKSVFVIKSAVGVENQVYPPNTTPTPW